MKLYIFFFSLIRKFTEASILRTHFIYAVLSYIKIMIIFNNTSDDFVLISADVILKIITILKKQSPSTNS